jgi:ribosomal-protein-alanine N-acetyltransferase
VLIGATIWLRPVTTDDAQLQADWRNDPEWSGPYQNHWPTSRQEEERRIAEPKLPDEHRYVIIGRDTDQAMGHVQYWNPFTMGGFYLGREIGYAVHPAFRSRGVATQAVCLLVNHLFDATPIERIQASTHVENEASRRVVEAAGLRREGVLHKVAFIHGRYVDQYLYAIVRDDWNDEATYRAARRPF